MTILPVHMNSQRRFFSAPCRICEYKKRFKIFMYNRFTEYFWIEDDLRTFYSWYRVLVLSLKQIFENNANVKNIEVV